MTKPTPKTTPAKTITAATVTLLLFLVYGLTSHHWADAETIGPALTVLLTPFFVWLIPNKETS